MAASFIQSGLISCLIHSQRFKSKFTGGNCDYSNAVISTFSFQVSKEIPHNHLKNRFKKKNYIYIGKQMITSIKSPFSYCSPIQKL